MGQSTDLVLSKRSPAKLPPGRYRFTPIDLACRGSLAIPVADSENRTMSWPDSFLRAPLVPIAVVATAGILLDRYQVVSWTWWSGLAMVGLLLWLLSARFPRLAWIGLMLAATGVAALHHHTHRHFFPANDIGFAVTDEPKLARLRGIIIDEPTIDIPVIGDPLRSIPETARTFAVVAAQALVGDDHEQRVSGKVSVTLSGRQSSLGVGDAVDLTGWLNRPRSPDNPGERDHASLLLDQRIRATMLVRKLADDTVQAEQATDEWLDRALGSVRSWSRRQLEATLPPQEAAVAAALLLGDGSAMMQSDWSLYIRTGVVHVLAVSGQHLAVLAGFSWLFLRILGIPRRPGAVAVALGLCAYAAIVGIRPPVLRAAVMAIVVCGGILLRRPARPANTIAFAWLAIVMMNPTDIFSPGCQFSFLCVAILVWGFRRWTEPRPADPLQALVEAAQPAWQRWLRVVARSVAYAFVLNIVIGVLVWPLTAWHYHMISPAGLLIGPLAVVLASIALIAGFFLLFMTWIAPPLAAAPALVTHQSLNALMWLVQLGDGLPFSHYYVGEVALWWVIGFYLVVAGVIWLWPKLRLTALGALAAWLLIGLACSFVRPQADELRVAFMAVGHGGATLVETPDGRVILFDAGSMTGPDITRRIIAPYLWHRGIRRIDDLFVTHADLDHFNGVPSLMERFHVGRINLTPSFLNKPTAGAGAVIRRLVQDQVMVRIVQAGDRFQAGAVEFEVLHPPAVGPPGPENARSLVIMLRHAGHAIALTGDLDMDGRSMLMAQAPGNIDVWMAPHHGGKSANPSELAAWVRPRLALAHNGTNEAAFAAANYRHVGAEFLSTWPDGAVTIISRRDGLWAESYKTRRRVAIHSAAFR